MKRNWETSLQPAEATISGEGGGGGGVETASHPVNNVQQVLFSKGVGDWGYNVERRKSGIG